jgi:hypothetical protein
MYTVYLFLEQETFVQKWQNSTDLQRLGLAILIQITQTCDQMSLHYGPTLRYMSLSYWENARPVPFDQNVQILSI